MATKVLTTHDPLGQLITRRIPAGTIHHRIYPDRHPDPLGHGPSRSRFSDPRSVKHPFGILYAGATFEVAFLETLVRDRRNQNPGTLTISMAELDCYVHVPIVVGQTLEMVDLRNGNPIAMGIPTDAVRARSHRLGRRMSLSFYRHPDNPDGVCYPSRLNEQESLAIYDRAIHKLSAGPRRRLTVCGELAGVLDRYRIAVV